MTKIRIKAEFTTVLYASIASVFLGVILLGILQPEYVSQYTHVNELYGSMSTLFVGAVGALLGYFGLKTQLALQQKS